MHTTSLLIRGNAGTIVGAAVLLLVGCGEGDPITTMPVRSDPVPGIPDVSAGQAALSGRVQDADGHPIGGAVVKIAETDGTADTDADGAYQLTVPSDSTLTVMATAPGFAPTFRESVIMASQAAVAGFDVLLLPTAEVNAINTLGAPGQESTRGVIAVRLHSTDPACVTAGAHVTVWPPLAARVVYSRPSAAGGLDQPDLGVDGVQAGANIDLWLAAAMPPANLLTIKVERPGCQVMDPAPSLGGLTFPGQRHVAAQALTEADLFLDGAPAGETP